MTAQEIWTTFLDAGLPAEPLKQLGHYFFYQRSAPTGDGVQAVNMLAAKFGIQPNFMFMALKVDPDPGLLERKQILEQLAFDYAHHKPWAEPNHMTTWYIGRIAFKVNIIKGGPNINRAKADRQDSRCCNGFGRRRCTKASGSCDGHRLVVGHLRGTPNQEGNRSAHRLPSSHARFRFLQNHDHQSQKPQLRLKRKA